MIKSNYIYSVLVSCLLSQVMYTQTQVGPGGVGDASNMAIWLDASQLGLSNGDPVTTWNDESGNGNNVTQGAPSQQATFNSVGPMNSMPSVSFDGNDALETGAIPMLSTDEYSWFIVSKSNSQYFTGANAFLLQTNTTFSSATWRAYLYRSNDFDCGNQFFGLRNPIAIKRALSPIGARANLTNSMIVNAVLFPGDNMSVRTNGGSLGVNTGLNHSGFNHLNTIIGYTGTGSDAGFRGDMSEVIIFSKSINSSEEKIIQNYLGAKYGISLAVGAAIYTHGSTHFLDVTGIGRDDASNQHLSAKGTGILEVTASSLDDADYLMWGHNGAALTTQTTNVPPDYLATNGEVMTRTWKVTEVGETDDVTFVFDMTGLNFGTSDDYQLLIDNDGDFTNGGTVQVDGTFLLDELTFNVPGGDLSSNNFFTIGNKNTKVISIVDGQNWSDPNTWNCTCIPGVNHSVIIDNGHEVILTDDREVINFTINPTGLLTLNSGANINISGDVNIEGSIDADLNSGFNFVGSTAQIMNAVGTISFGNVELNNSAGLTLSSGQYLFNGILTPTDGNMDFGNTDITFTSNATGTAVIGVTGAGASFSGMSNVKVQRFIPTGVAGYRDIGSPLNTMPLRQWDDELFISGTGFPDGCAYSANGCFHSVSWWDPSKLPAAGYRTVNDIDSLISNGTGLEIYLGDNLNSFAGRALTATGIPNTSLSVDIPVQNGWNLISNPFLSPIDFDNVTRNGSTGNYFYVYDPNISGFQYWNGADGNPINQSASVSHLNDGILSSSQGFWVFHSGASSTLTINQVSKSVNAPDQYLRSNSSFLPHNNLYFELFSTNGNQKAIGGVKLLDQWKSNEVSNLPKISIPNLETVSVYTLDDNGNEVVINSINHNEACFTLPVYADVLRSGEYSIDFKNPQGEYDIFVKNNTTGEVVLLVHDARFEFRVDGETKKVNPFNLEFKKSSECEVDGINHDIFDVYLSFENIQISTETPLEQDVTVTVMNSLGAQVSQNVIMSKETSNLLVDVNGLSGLYLVVIRDLNGNVIKLEKLFISK